jgi:TetR/AcrR family fatty acid metabolism transcriptional regulator
VTREKVPDKRQRILDAALQVFAERGYYNAKVAEVARQAGVADGTIYLYFENKDDLLINLFEDRMDFLIRRLREDLEQHGGTVPERIRRLMHLHLRLAVEAPALAEFITVELRQSSKFVKEYENPRFQQYLVILRDLVEEGQRDGSLDERLDPRNIVRAIFGSLDEILLSLTLASRRKPVNLARAADDLADIFLRGIEKSPGAGAGRAVVAAEAAVVVGTGPASGSTAHNAPTSGHEEDK